MNQRDRIGAAMLVAGCSCFAYFLLFKFPLTPIFAESDQLIFIHEGTRLLQGDVMYRDFFQFTFPGTQVYYRALLSIFGQSYLLLPFTIILLIACLSYLSFRISHEMIDGPLAYLPTLIFIFFGTRYFGLDASHRLFSIVFVLLAIVVLIGKSTAARSAIAGLICALASFFTQQRGVVMVGAIACFLIVEAYATNGKWREVLRNLAVLCVSFAIGITLLVSYFVAAAEPAEFFFATLEFPIRYYGSAAPNETGVFFADLAKAADSAVNLQGITFLICSVFYAVIVSIGVAAVIVLLISKRRQLEWSELRLPVLLLLVWTSFFVTTTGHSPGRMFQISIPALIIICWYLARLGALTGVVSNAARAAAAGLILLGLSQAIRMQIGREYQLVDLSAGRVAFASTGQARFYKYLADATEPGEFIYEAAQPFVYFPLQLKNPTGMSQVWPSDYTRPEQVEAVVRDLNERRPKFIVWPSSYSIADATRRPGDHTGPLAAFVAENYVPTGQTWTSDGFTVEIMKRKED